MSESRDQPFEPRSEEQAANLDIAVTRKRLSDDLHSTVHRIRATDPVVWVPELEGWLVTSYAFAVNVLRDAEQFTVDDDRFSTGRVVGPSMLSTDGDRHRHHRQPFEAMFRAKPVADSRETIATTVDHLLDGLLEAKSGDLRSEYAAPLAVKVITDFLGLTNTDDPPGTDFEVALLKSYREIVPAVSELRPGRPVPDTAAVAVANLNNILERALRTRANRPSRSFVDMAASNVMCREHFLSNTAVILFGAIETSEAMTANAIYHLQQWSWDASRRRAQDEELTGFCRLAVAESLRLEPAAAVVDRYANRSTRLGEAQIRARDLVIVSLAGANRDPSVFTDPDRFDPDRRNSARHLAFARGPHTCLGIHLARQQTASALERLIQRAPSLAVDWDESDDPSGLIFRKPCRLFARW